MELYFLPLGGVPPKLRRLYDGGSSWHGWHGWHGRSSTRAIRSVLGQWRRRSRERRLLAQFGERERHDLALTPSDIRREIAKPFWRG